MLGCDWLKFSRLLPVTTVSHSLTLPVVQLREIALIHCNNFRISDMVRTKIDFSSCKPTFSLCLPQIKLKNDKLNIAKISVSKLSKIIDPQTKLRKAVLINNTLKSLHKLSEPWMMDTGGRLGLEDDCEPSEEREERDISTENTSHGHSCIKNFSNQMELEKNTLSEDMLTLYDDIINDIFGKNESESELSPHRQEDQDKEVELDNFKENNCLWSPYSYNSFLSELYTVSNKEKLQT